MATAQQVGQFGSWELDLGNRVDINANPLRWSDETFRIFGYAPGSVPVTNDLFFHAVPPDEREAIQQTIAEAIAGHDPYSCVHRVCRPDGEERTVRETARFFESDGQGKPARLVGTVHDITDRIRVEEALERTNREILATWESMTDGFFAIDTNWQFTHINSQGAQLLSTTREKVIGVSIWDAFPEAVNTTISYREYHRALEEQVSVGFEEFYAPLGKWFEVRAYPSSVGLSVYFHDITERKQSEAALNDSEREHLLLIRRLEEKSASLAEAQAIAKVGSWELDLGTRAVTWSDETFRIFGVKPEDFRGTSESVKESVHPEDLPMIRKAFADSISDRTPCSLDHRLLMRDGTIKFVHERCITYYDNDGRPIRSVGTTQDITTRKEAEAERDMIEKALRQSRNQFRSVVETVESLFISDHQGRIVDVNQNACDSLGYTREEMLHLRVPDFELNADPETFDLNWQRMASGDRKPFLVDGVEKRKDGSTFPVEVRIGMLETEGNLQVVAVARDITDRKKAEEERDRFFTLSLDMLAIVSSDGYFKRLNPAFEATLGYTDAEFMSKPLLEYIHPDDVASTQVQMTNLGRGIEDVSFDNRYRCSDGSYKWLRWAAAPFKDLWYCVAHDITEEMHAAEALHDANERLELRVIERTAQLENSNREMGIAREEADRANEAKSDFLSRMSHELRTPLNGILGFAQLMEMDTPSPKQAVRLGHILKSGQHLLQLINEVLDLARAESGRLHLSAEPVSLGDSVQGAVDIIRPLAEKRNQQILFDWYTSEPLYVHADQQRLSQVLLNLLSNATKFGRKGGTIIVHCQHSREGWMSVSISDNGFGIAADQLERIFEPFVRLGEDEGIIEGTGLGLSLSKRMVEMMGGTLIAVSQVGMGSTFVVELPQSESPMIRILAQLPEPHLLPTTDQQHTLLYIEDNVANLQLVEHILDGRSDYLLRSAHTGLGGQQMARELLPSLILLDLHLPDIPGDEVLKRLHADPVTRDIPVVMVSADATPTQIQRLLAAGASDYLTKPLDVRLFLEMIHKLVRLKDHSDA